MEYEEKRLMYHYTLLHEDPKSLQQLLQSGNHSTIKEIFGIAMNPINRCILVSKFRNVSILFQLFDKTDFVGNEEEYYENMSCIAGNFSEEVLPRIRKTASTPRRYQHLLQILLIFFSKDVKPSDAKDALRLIWASRHDPLITFLEIENALKDDFSPETIKNIYDYYTEAVGTKASMLEPRSLKQLCRTMIRSKLCKKDFWLPAVINEMDLPIALKGFLNLER